MNDCTPALTLGPEHSLNQPEKNLLGDEGKRRHQSIVGATMYLAHLSRHDILNAVNQLARGMSKPSRAHMVVGKHLLRYFTGSNDFINYEQGEFKLAAFSDANRGNTPDNGKSTSYIVMLANGAISSNVGLQGLIAQLTIEVELVAAALTMKEAVLCKSMMQELGFKDGFNGVPLFIYNT